MNLSAIGRKLVPYIFYQILILGILIGKLMDPGWIEPEEQVARINALVMKNDTFVCLGDVGDASFVKQIRARKKILLLGNHDKKKDYKGLFDEIYDGPIIDCRKNSSFS